MNIYIAKFLFYLLRFLLDIFDDLLLLLRIYRVLCFVKITFEQLPMYNPYKWPLSFIRVLTRPYLAFWDKFLPNVRFGNMTFEISTMVALEVLSCLSEFSIYIRLYLFNELNHVSSLIK